MKRRWLTLKNLLSQITINLIQHAYWGIGYLEDGEDQEGAGYRVIDGALVAFTVTGGTFTTSSLGSVDVTVMHTYEIRWSVALSQFQFWIDGVEVATLSTGYPAGPLDELAAFYIKNDAAAGKYMYISNFFFQSDR